jgi:hypothetical protein
VHCGFVRAKADSAGCHVLPQQSGIELQKRRSEFRLVNLDRSEDEMKSLKQLLARLRGSSDVIPAPPVTPVAAADDSTTATAPPG